MIMAKNAKLSGDLLDDSAATLRLVDTLIDELREGNDEIAAESAEVSRALGGLTIRPAGLVELPRVLLRAYSETMGALETLQRSRSVLEQTTVERVHRTHAKLQEVSSATEMAATDMLNGLDHALSLIDRLDAASESGEGEADSSTLRAELRDEVFRLMSCLQFQDITSQQLRYASGVLEEIEQRLTAIADLFDMSIAGLDGGEQSEDDSMGSSTFDPAASMLHSETRQAVADEIFTIPVAVEGDR